MDKTMVEMYGAMAVAISVVKETYTITPLIIEQIKVIKEAMKNGKHLAKKIKGLTDMEQRTMERLGYIFTKFGAGVSDYVWNKIFTSIDFEFKYYL